MPADLATAASTWTVTTRGMGEPDYDAIYAAVVGTAEGRWFLAQYASRNRNTDTAQVLAAIDRLESEVGRERSAPPAAPAQEPSPPPPGPDIARLRRDLGEFADALMRARADVAAIKPGKVTARPTILAATEALQGLAWFMRERGTDSRFCDRIDDCADDILAVCAIPDLAVQRTRTIIDVLGDLENRLHAIRSTLDGGDQFDDLRTSPAANANSPAAAKPAGIEAEMVDAGIEASTPDLAAEIEPPASSAGTENVATENAAKENCATENIAPAGAETTAPAATALPAAEIDRYLDTRPAANPGGTQTSPRLSHLLMAAELDRLLDAQGATETGANDQPPPEPVAATAPVEAPAPVAAAPPDEVTAPIEAAAPADATAPVEAAPSETIEVDVAPLEPEALSIPEAHTIPETPSIPVAPSIPVTPPRRVAALTSDLFADVMALSEEERIALFT
jgi:chemotaxis protein CheZ